MRLTQEQENLLPSEADMDFYQEHGYFVSGKILPDEVIDAAVKGAERHWAGERDWTLTVSGGFAEWKPGDGEGIRNSEYTALQNREIRRLVEFPIIGAIAARLARTSLIRLWDDQLIAKPASTGPSGPVVGWHTDRAYWMTCTSEEMLTAWIPLQDTPAQMGPIMYIDGSHLWPGTDEMRNFNSTELAAIEHNHSSSDILVNKCVIALKKGQVSFHHCRMIHGSDVNRGDGPRRSIALHMQDAKNRYRDFRNSEGVPWRVTNDVLARKDINGLPDYADPAVFPILWSDSGSGNDR